MQVVKDRWQVSCDINNVKKNFYHFNPFMPKNIVVFHLDRMQVCRAKSAWPIQLAWEVPSLCWASVWLIRMQQHFFLGLLLKHLEPSPICCKGSCIMWRCKPVHSFFFLHAVILQFESMSGQPVCLRGHLMLMAVHLQTPGRPMP